MESVAFSQSLQLADGAFLRVRQGRHHRRARLQVGAILHFEIGRANPIAFEVDEVWGEE
jgi:hypothetical protein